MSSIMHNSEQHDEVIKALSATHDAIALERSNKLYAAEALLIWATEIEMAPVLRRVLEQMRDKAAQLRKEAE